MGRRRLRDGEAFKGICGALKEQMDSLTASISHPPLIGTCFSTRGLQGYLAERRLHLSHVSIAALLSNQGFRLQTVRNEVRKTGKDAVNVSRQFLHVCRMVKKALDHEDGVLWIDLSTRRGPCKHLLALRFAAEQVP